MPDNIKVKHIERMFPFEFFDELNACLPEYVMGNQAFVLNHKNEMPTEKRKELYTSSIIATAAEALSKNNIVDVQPFGEVLFLDICYRAQDIDRVIANVERSQIPMSILMIQLYDSSYQPIFSKDVTDDTISKIPEVLWDDPNLLISIITLADECDGGTIVTCLKIPEVIENTLFEDVDA